LLDGALGAVCELPDRATTGGSGEAHVLVALDGHLAGVIVMADELRPDAEHLVERLRAEGVRYVAMISGDRRSVAERVGRELGVDRVYSEQSPEDRLGVVRTVGADGRPGDLHRGARHGATLRRPRGARKHAQTGRRISGRNEPDGAQRAQAVATTESGEAPAGSRRVACSEGAVAVDL